MSTANKLSAALDSKAAIKAAIEEKGVEIGDVPFSQYAGKISEISTHSGGWQPQPDWWDIETIIREDDTPEYAEKPKAIELLIDGDDVTELKLAQAYRTSDGAFYPASGVSHTWDKTKDKPCSEGYKTRYVIYYDISGDFKPGMMALGVFVDGHNGNLTFSAFAQYKELLQYAILKNINIQYSAYLFYCAYSISKIDIDGEIFRNMTSVAYSFYGIKTDPPYINSSSCKDFTGLYYFARCDKIPRIDTSSGTNFRYMFREAKISYIPDLDTSNGTDFEMMFYQTAIPVVPRLDTSKGTKFDNMFGYCYTAEIPEIDMTNAISCVNMFVNSNDQFNKTRKLGGFKNLKLSLDLSHLIYLTHESLLNVLNKLAAIDTPQTLTLGTANLAKLTDAEKAIATSKGWTLA